MSERIDPRELLKGTTPGPWRWIVDGHRNILAGLDDERVLQTSNFSGRGTSDEDLALIAAARELAERLAKAEGLIRDFTSYAKSVVETGRRIDASPKTGLHFASTEGGEALLVRGPYLIALAEALLAGKPKEGGA